MRQTGPPTRRTPLRARSPKRAKFYRETRAPLVAALLSDNPPCERCHATTAVDVHEIQTRARGGSLTDRDNLALLCRPCHDWVGRNPAQAALEGWLRPSTY